jgi:hypothetical protein
MSSHVMDDDGAVPSQFDITSQYNNVVVQAVGNTDDMCGDNTPSTHSSGIHLTL